MSRFIPVNHEKAEALENKLSQEIFRSVKDFVEFYNSGLISKNHEDVKKISREITETFKDVKEKNSKLVFISEEEVALEESLRVLKSWESLVKAKREINEAIEQKIVTLDSRILLDDNGYLNTVAEDEETGEINVTTISNEKVVSRKDEVGVIAEHIDSTANHSEHLGGYTLPVKNIAELDTSFVLQVKELLPTV